MLERRARIAYVTALLAVSCATPQPADGGMSSDAGRGSADAGSHDGSTPCPAAPDDVIGEACDSAGRVCRTDECASAPCTPACIEIVCQGDPDGAHWQRLAACADAGPDAGVADAGADGGTAACSAFAADGASTIHDIDASGALRAIVWDGTGYALVWSELESTSPVLLGLYFARARADGELVPGSAHRILPAGQYQLQAALARGDGELGLAYLDLPSDGFTVGLRAHFVRLSLDGAPIAGSDVQLSEEHPPHEAVAITYAPPLNQWAVAWQGTVPLGGGYVNSHVYLSRIDETGAVLDPNAVQLDAETSTTSPGEAPSFVWTGDRYAIILAEFVDIPDTRVSIAEIDPTTAEVTRRIVLHEGGRPTRAVLTTDGTLYGAAWMQIGWDSYVTNEVRFRTAAVGGDALSTEVVLADGMSSGEPSITFDGTTFRLAFYHGDADTGGVWYARFDRDGAPIGTASERFAGTPPYSAFPLIASDGCNDAIGWTAISSGSPQTASIRVHTIAGAM